MRLALSFAASAVVTAMGLVAPVGSVHAERDTVGHFVERYGTVDPAHSAAVSTAHAVFARLLPVADVSSKRTPAFVVVASDAGPWAVALPDGYIVLSRRAVTVCEDPKVHLEACLAFIIGHELAHLAHDDFLHHEVYQFLRQSKATRSLARKFRGGAGAEGREYAADDAGFVYAAMAGYPVAELLDKSGNESPFFASWVRQANLESTEALRSADERVALLGQRLRDIAAKLRLFEYGVRLAHFDHCDDALLFFRSFQRVFAGREVHANLGFCHLQLARQHMAAERAYFYALPIVLETETRAARIRLRSDRATPGHGTLRALATGGEPARASLERAISHLERATKADPGYRVARLNLATAFLYAGKPHHARAAVAELRSQGESDSAAAMLDAVALYEQSEAGLDLWDIAVQRLQQLATGTRPDARAIFNLARLHELRGNEDEARALWRRLSRPESGAPRAVAVAVCARVDAPGKGQCARSRASAPPPDWKWPAPTRGLPEFTPTLARRLAGYEVLDVAWPEADVRGRIFTQPGGGRSLLELDGFVQMQVVAGDSLGEPDGARAACPSGLRARQVGRGEILSCGQWAVLVRDGRVREGWWMAR